MSEGFAVYDADWVQHPQEPADKILVKANHRLAFIAEGISPNMSWSWSTRLINDLREAHGVPEDAAMMTGHTEMERWPLLVFYWGAGVHRYRRDGTT